VAEMDIVVLVGVTPMETKTGGVTVKIVDPLIEPEVAVIVVVPVDAAVASPAELIVATPTADEVQITLFVMFAVVPLL
jgi:hypothetical protein